MKTTADMMEMLDNKDPHNIKTYIPTAIDYTIFSNESTVSTPCSDETNTSFDAHLIANRLPPGSITLNKNEYLGRGAFGQVYREKWGSRLVAVKEVDIKLAQQRLGLNEEEALESLQWEVSRLSTASHPNIVQFYGLYNIEEDRTKNQKTYLVIEYCEEGDLKKVLAKDPGWSKKWQWALEITQGLAYLHHQGMLHRDLKAENILIDGNGRAKLADLGVAQVDDLLQQKESSLVAQGIQDRRYKAPEALSNSELSTYATDIYALGLVFWQLVSASEPRRGTTNNEILSWMQSGQREVIPENCPTEFQEIILDCWQLDPDKRPSVEQIIARLNKMALQFHAQPDWLKLSEALDEQIHPNRTEAFKYIAPYVTAYRVDEDLDTYWQHLEIHPENKEGIVTSKDITGNPPLELRQILDEFLASPQSSTLVLLGESGLGKTLSTYQLADSLLTQWWSYLKDNKGYASYCPIFIRPLLNKWSYSELNGAIKKAFRQHQLDMSLLKFKNAHWLIIIDGYDECQADITPQNLPEQLGLNDLPNAKLLVTCRPNTVTSLELQSRFALDGNLVVRHFLPFSIHQLLSYLKTNLCWDNNTYNHYQEKFQQSPELRAVLRNPFVLSLLVQSWETLKERDFNQLNHWQIYQGFVEHWVKNQKNLLSNNIQSILSARHPNFLASFNAFASEAAFKAFQQKTIDLFTNSVELSSETSSWFNLRKTVLEDSQKTFKLRQERLGEKNLRRALLSEQDYIIIMERRLKQFEAGLPLKNKALSYEFSHKTFFEYFTARRIVELRGKTPQHIVKEGLELLNSRSLQEEPETLNFIAEAWEEANTQLLKEPFFKIIDCSKQESSVAQAAANAITVLNIVRTSFSGMDFNGIKIFSADLSNAICDHANFESCDLSFVKFYQTSLKNTSLKKAIMKEVDFGELPSLKINSLKPSYCCYSKNGLLLAVADGKNIQIYNTQNYLLVYNLKGHTDYITNLSFSSNGNILASASLDNTINLWNINKRKLLTTFQGHQYRGSSISFSFDGALLASAGSQSTIKLWDIEQKRLFLTLEGHTDIVNSVSFNPINRMLASGSWDTTIRLWNVESGEALRILEGHSSTICSVCFNPINELLASASIDTSIRLWDTEKIEKPLLGDLKSHTNDILNMSFDSGGKLLASCSFDNTIRLWNIEEGMLKIIFTYTSYAKNIFFSPNGKEIISENSNGSIGLWDVNQGNLQKVLYCAATYENEDNNNFTIATFNQNNELWACSSNNNVIQLWNVRTGEIVKILNEKTNSKITCIAFSKNGELLASAVEDDGDIKLWNLKTGEVVKILKEETYGKKITTLYFNLSDEILVSIAEPTHELLDDNNNESICIWDVKLGQQLLIILRNHTSLTDTVCFDPNNKLLASSDGMVIKMWDVKQAKLLANLKGHTNNIISLSFSPNGEFLASISYDNNIGICKVYDNVKDQVHSVEGNITLINTYYPISKLVWNKNFKNRNLYLATAHGMPEDSSAVSISYWRVVNQKNVAHLKLIWNTRKLSKKLSAEGCNIEDVTELSFSNKKLLEQNGAIGVPNIIPSLILGAKSGDINSQAELGKHYKEGKLVVQNLDKALKWLTKAANHNHPIAQFNLALIYLKGEGVASNIDKARKLFMLSAKNGSSEAQVVVGNYYLNGESVDKNLDKSFKWFNKSAKQKNADGQFNLGVCHQYGQGCSKDLRKAVKYYTKAAQQCHIQAQTTLLNMNIPKVDEDDLLWWYVEQNDAEAQYEAGHVFYFESLEKAAKLWEKSAEQGNAKAQNSLGECYSKGEGVSQNLDLAVQFWKISATQGNKDAQFNLAKCYENGVGISQDLNKATELYIKLSAQEHIKAQVQLGCLYKEGKVVVQDYKQAFELFIKAARENRVKYKYLKGAETLELGNVDAKFNLGICYHYGQGTDKNLKKAIKYYTEAAEQNHLEAKKNLEELNLPAKKSKQKLLQQAKIGDAKAQNKLALCYYTGEDFVQDINKAVEWWSYAAKQKNIEAMISLGKMYKNGEGIEKNLKIAAKYLVEAANLDPGNIEAEYWAGVFYEEGLGITQDSSQAFRYFLNITSKNEKNTDYEICAHYYLGFMYYQGHGVTQDYQKANEHFEKFSSQKEETSYILKNWEKRANNGDCLAQSRMGFLYKNGLGIININLEKAIELFIKSAEKGNINAKISLASCYEEGKGIPQDLNKSMEWYTKAVEQGSKNAQTKLENLTKSRALILQQITALESHQKTLQLLHEQFATRVQLPPEPSDSNIEVVSPLLLQYPALNNSMIIQSTNLKENKEFIPKNNSLL